MRVHACDDALKPWHIFVAIGGIFRTVCSFTARRLNKVVSQVAVTGFYHWCIIGVELTGLVIPPDNATILDQDVVIVKTPDESHFGKYPGSIHGTNSGNGLQ